MKKMIVGLLLLATAGCVSRVRSPVADPGKAPVLQSPVEVKAPPPPPLPFAMGEAKKSPEECPPVYRPVVIHDDFSQPGEYAYRAPNGDVYRCGPNGCVLERRAALPGYDVLSPKPEEPKSPVARGGGSATEVEIGVGLGLLAALVLLVFIL